MENPSQSVFDELEQQQQSYFEYATTGQRFANYLVDLVLFYLLNTGIFIVIAVILALTGESSEVIQDVFANKLVTISISYIDYFLVYTLIEGFSKGRSLGKLLTGTIAVKQDLSKITWDDALKRSLSRLIPFEPLSGLGGTPWHDTWSKTTVIKKRPKI